MHPSGKYVIDALNNTTYLLIDSRGHKCYALLVDPIRNGWLNAQLTLVEVENPENQDDADRYLIYGAEIWSFQLYGRDACQVKGTAATILQSLTINGDIDQPVSLTVAYGGRFYGKPVECPPIIGGH